MRIFLTGAGVMVHRILFCLLVVFGSGVCVADELRPVPAAREIGKANTVIRQLFGKDLAESTTPQQQRRLAQRLQKLAQSDAPAPQQWACHERAIELLMTSGDVTLACGAVDVLGETFEVDVVQRKLAILQEMRRSSRDPKQLAAVVDIAGALLDDAAAGEQFETGGNCVQLLQSMFPQIPRGETKSRAIERMNVFRDVAERHSQYNSAAERLLQGRGGASDRLTVGTYRCLYRGEWWLGLKMLAEGSDPAISAAAQAGRADPEEPLEQFQLAEMWWTLSFKYEGQPREELRRHAGQFYQKCALRLTALYREVALQRLKELRLDPIAADGSLKPIIESARWGGGKKWADVTERVRQLVVTGQPFWANTRNLKSDPTPGWRKKLQIVYVRNGETRSLWFNENTQVKLGG